MVFFLEQTNLIVDNDICLFSFGATQGYGVSP